MTFTDIEDYNMRSIAILGCNIYSQITVAHIILPKAVLNTVEIFAVYGIYDEKIVLSQKLVVDEVLKILNLTK